MKVVTNTWWSRPWDLLNLVLNVWSQPLNTQHRAHSEYVFSKCWLLSVILLITGKGNFLDSVSSRIGAVILKGLYCFCFFLLSLTIRSYPYQIAILMAVPPIAQRWIPIGSNCLLFFTFCWCSFRSPKSFAQTPSLLPSLRPLQWAWVLLCQVWIGPPHQIWAVGPWARYLMV